MKQNRITFAIAIVLSLVVLAMLFVFQVRTTEVAVVTTFGRISRTAGPGPHFRLPLIQGVHKFDKRIQVHRSAFEQVYTSDQYALLVAVYVGWNIDDAETVLNRFSSDPDLAIEKAGHNLEGMIRNAYSGVIGTHPFSHFVSTDEKQLKFVEIEQEVQARLQAECRSITNGLNIAFLGIERMGLPESVTKEVFKNMESERERLVTAITSDGERRSWSPAYPTATHPMAVYSSGTPNSAWKRGCCGGWMPKKQAASPSSTAVSSMSRVAMPVSMSQ